MPRSPESERKFIEKLIDRLIAGQPRSLELPREFGADLLRQAPLLEEMTGRRVPMSKLHLDEVLGDVTEFGTRHPLARQGYREAVESYVTPIRQGERTVGEMVGRNPTANVELPSGRKIPLVRYQGQLSQEATRRTKEFRQIAKALRRGPLAGVLGLALAMGVLPMLLGQESD